MTTSWFGNAVVVGHGLVGRMMCSLLAPSTGRLVAVDRCGDESMLNGTECAVADVEQPFDPETRALFDQADLIVTALPDEAAVEFLRGLPGREGTVIVDTCSVKHGVGALWDRLVAAGRTVASINPMFGPSLPPAGHPVLAVTRGDRLRAEQFLDVLTRGGLQVTRLEDAAQHDRLAAVTQAGVHAAALALGATFVASGVPAPVLASVASPPARMLMCLLARMTTAMPAEVYQDVQVGNPRAADARRALSRGLDGIDEAVGSERLAERLAEISEWLGPSSAELSDQCRSIFELLVPRGPTPKGTDR